MESMNIALASIDFQDGKFFKDLTSVIEKLNGFGKDLTDKQYYLSPEVNALPELIKRYTNLNTDFFNGLPAAKIPRIHNSSVLAKGWVNELSEYYKEIDLFADVRNITFVMGKKVIDGYVDINKSKVFGAYEQILTTIYFPRSWFANDKFFTAAECAAMILHEIGHIFTQLEYIGRTVSTNQVLAAMIRSLDNTVPEDTRTAIFARGMELLKLTSDEQKALLNTKNKTMVTCVVIDSAVRTTISELGCNVYDSTSCEQLADQFASRHGAGRHIVTSLDKIAKYTGTDAYSSRSNVIKFIQALGKTVISGGTYSLFLLITFIKDVANASRYDKTYDSSKSRYSRIKLQNIEQLKDREISKELKAKLLFDNIIIDDIISLYNDNLSFIDKVAHFLKPSYRDALKYELLQKNLEDLSSNDLFTASAKLATI